MLIAFCFWTIQSRSGLSCTIRYSPSQLMAIHGVSILSPKGPSVMAVDERNNLNALPGKTIDRSSRVAYSAMWCS